MISQAHASWGYLDDGIFVGSSPIMLDNVQRETAIINRRHVKPQDEPVIAVLGVGYVGSHLVTSFSKRFKVIGYDVSKQRIEQLLQGDYMNGIIEYTNEPENLVRATHFLISVPTLLKEDRSIDSSYLQDAIKTVAKVARRGSTVVMESSVAVGMTRELLGPIAKHCGLFAGMSPEVSMESSDGFSGFG
jgi:UDP-N-acetyl-D-mannosaminuronate dehydrogenase